MAIPNIVPRANDSGETLGTPTKKWSNVHTMDVSINGMSAAGKFSDIDEATSNLSTNKADKTNVYTKAEMDTSLGNKANSSDVYVKAEVYTKTETDNKVATKLDKNQGSANADKVLMVGADGTVVPMDAPSGIDVGMIIPYAGNGDIPVGFLLCNGASVSKITYPALFEAIGYTYGGSGSYFNLPNLVDKFIEGATSQGEYKEAGLPNITGIFALVNSGAFFNQNNTVTDGAIYRSENRTPNVGNYSVTGSGAGNHILGIDASRSSAIYGNSDTVQPPSLTMRYIIKAFAGASADSTDVAITNVANDLVSLAGTSEIVASGDGYVRYANGLQICYFTHSFTITDETTNWSVTYPIAFSITPIVSVNTLGSWSTNRTGDLEGISEVDCYGYFHQTGASLPLNVSIQIIAIGRWK